MEVVFLDPNYKCFIDISFFGGDIQFDVSDDKQLFSFKSGIGFVAIPHFFSTLTSLKKGEISEARLVCHGNGDYYILTRVDENLFIEYVNYPINTFNYQFKLKEYMEAIDMGFKKYLQ